MEKTDASPVTSSGLWVDEPPEDSEDFEHTLTSSPFSVIIAPALNTLHA